MGDPRGNQECNEPWKVLRAMKVSKVQGRANEQFGNVVI